MAARIDIECGSIEIFQENTLLLTYKDNYFVEIDDALKIKDAFETLCPEGPIYCIVNLKKQFLNMSSEAQVFLARKSPVLPRVMCTGFVLNNLPSRLIIMFFINRFRPTYPTRVFSNVDAAIAWADSIKAKNN